MDTFANYLAIRLEQLGVDRLFGVAGNYTAPFLNTVIDRQTIGGSAAPIHVAHNSNELCAAYAADGYARLGRIGVVHVTYSVGAFSLLNAIAGSFTEQVPVIVINGAPTNKENAVEQNAGLLYSHTTGNPMTDIDVFRPVTVAAERISDAQRGALQVDSALTSMLTHRRPVYLEVTEDVWRAPCAAPTGSLVPGTGTVVQVSQTQQAVDATLELLRQRPKSVFWAGIELQRLGLAPQFLDLLAAVNPPGLEPEARIPFVTTALSKSVVSEHHVDFDGCVTLSRDEIGKLVGDNGCVIGLGAWTTGKDTHNENIRGPGVVLAAHDGVWVGADYFPVASLESFMAGLGQHLAQQRDRSHEVGLSRLTVTNTLARPATTAGEPGGAEAAASTALTYDSFFDSIDAWLEPSDVVVVDAGFPLIGAQSALTIAEPNGFVAQAAWLAIGYSVAAATGVSAADPNKRAIVIVGDGAFHETCQAVSDHHANGHNTVVFVIANGLYGIEQKIVNPNPFRDPPVGYDDPGLEVPYAYNELPKWDYAKVPDVFGGVGRRATDVKSLRTILSEVRATPDANFVIEIPVPSTDVPAATRAGLQDDVGEDEIANPNWPPVGVY